MVCGSYVLRLAVDVPQRVVFGRFGVVALPADTCVYVGSAMGQRGASTLARRLLRHATRAAGEPQPIREEMVAHFATVGLGDNLHPPRRKRPFWHVDYLLEETAVTLTHAIILRSTRRLEPTIAQLLNDAPETAVLRPGLGARDAPGATHLLRVPDDLRWWQTLAQRLAPLAAT